MWVYVFAGVESSEFRGIVMRFVPKCNYPKSWQKQLLRGLLPLGAPAPP